ncbi:MAG: hypothetical protein HY890_05050 [Deltaproteobacteria bacterium]|nr:hypothetical protein [Deltaproteobacteria bacterium]
MHIKRFRGKILEEALRAVKAAFGDDAVILSTKKGEGFAEVLAAVDFDVAEIEKRFGEDTAVKRELDGLKGELSEIRCLFSSAVKDGAVRELAGLGPGAVKLYEEMVRTGVRDELSRNLVRAAASEKGGGNLRDRVLRVINEKTTVCNPLAGGERPRLFALLGPTGVGKTTTIAKIAARLKVKGGAKVGLISIDTARPGANEVLKASARAIGVPVDSPATKEDFTRALWKYKDRDVVLIDTPGKNPVDSKAMGQLRHMLAGGVPVKTALVLSATARDESLFNACRGFARAMPIDCLVFTRLDETRQAGSIVNTSAFLKKPIAYLCDGQRIPDDIRMASSGAIGNLVFGRGHGGENG